MFEDDISLNDPQSDAVAHDEGPALILAGAGSGKTRVITSRAVRLISSGISPWSVFCVTFTNKAAGEMRSRIASSLNIDMNDLWISTFHSACLRILKEQYKEAGYPSMPVVFDATDQKSLVKSIIKGMGLVDADLPHGKVLYQISRYKNDMKGPEDMQSEAKFPNARETARAFFLYQEELRKNNAVDFDDLMLVVIKLFQSRPDVLQKYKEKFKYIMVDEFQDTNLVQYKLLQLLVSESRNIFAVGDDDQSIYRWRGARVGNILGFEKDFPNCKVIKLEENYRSTKNILKAAGEVVKKVAGRKEKELWTRQDAGAPITVYTAQTELDEVDYLVDRVMVGVGSGEERYGDFAVFYRTNAQSRVIEEALNRNRIPYRIYGGLKFYSRKEIKDIMAYFRLAVNEMDEVSFLRAIGAPPRGIGPATLSKLKNFATSHSLTLLEACEAEDNGIKGAAAAKLLDFYNLIKKIKAMLPGKPAGEVIEIALEESGIVNAFLDKRTAQDNSRVENLKELAGAPGKTEYMAEFIERAALQSDADLVDESADYLSLMTIHVSKGLEFPTVFMVGMEEDLFPHFNSADSIEEMDEERRLCYVGMTRAKKKLYLIHAITRRIYGDISTNDPSPFIDDIPAEIVEAKRSTKKPLPTYSHRKPQGSYSKSYSSDVPSIDLNADLNGGFGVGMNVKHKIFGNGVIKSSEGVGDEIKLTIRFSHAGIKRLSSKFVELV